MLILLKSDCWFNKLHKVFRLRLLLVVDVSATTCCFLSEQFLFNTRCVCDEQIVIGVRQFVGHLLSIH